MSSNVNDRTAERQNGRTTERPNDRTAERQNDRTTERLNDRTAKRQKSERSNDRSQNARTTEAATSDELRPLPYQAPPRACGVGTRQPSVGPLFTRNAVPSLSCRTAILVTNFCILSATFIHSIVVYRYSLMLLVNNATPPKKMQYAIIYHQPTASAIRDISHSNK